MTQPIGRRTFLQVLAGAGGGLLLGIGSFDDADAQQARGAGPTEPPFLPGAYVHIATNGRITLYSKNPEIGQGIKTAFGLILAEELDAKWSDVTVEQSAIDVAVYGNQSAGGSTSIPRNWMTLRQAGAGARALLLAAAARQWSVPVSSLRTADSTVIHDASGRKASYGSLATAAAALPPPDPQALVLKARKEFRLLGRRHRGVDGPAIVTGKPLFGIDVQLPGQVVAVFQKCPRIYGTARAANLDEIRRLPGVTDVFIVQGTGKPSECLSGVAILARNTWSALSARRQLKVEWDVSNASPDSWQRYVEQARALTTQPVGAQTVEARGDIDAALAGGHVVNGTYTYGFVAHAQLEPQNAAAWYRKDAAGDRVEVWAPSQTPTNGRALLASVLGLPLEQVTLHQTRVGGGFGRRLVNDYTIEAALISKQAGGIPVKLLWTREDDMEHDLYRSGGFMGFQASLDAQGHISGWRSHLVHFRSEGGTAVTAATWQPGEFPALHVPAYQASQTLLPLKIPTGSWRAPGSNTAAWVVQSFLHELSTAAKRDHAEFLLEVVGRFDAGARPEASGRPTLTPERTRNVIRAVTERSGWGRRSLPTGHALGMAFHYSHAGHFAEVAEVSVDAKKKITVHRMWVVGDVGPIVDLSSAENQCQGCIVDAISTLALEVTMEHGEIQQKNFDRYPIARMPISPEVDVHFLDTDYPPTGIGEPAFPPAAPAICNAVFTLTGQRIRTLPLTREGFSI